MKIEYENYEIEIVDDNFYVDNTSKHNYQSKYSGGHKVNGRSYAINKRGIIIKELNNESLFSSILLCENGGRTKISLDLFKIIEDDLLICIGDKIYCLKIPNLQINWFKSLPLGTNYLINSFKEDYLVFGEIGLVRINEAGEEIWHYKGENGIFIPGNGKLKISDSVIELIDGNDKKYIIDESGKEII